MQRYKQLETMSIALEVVDLNDLNGICIANIIPKRPLKYRIQYLKNEKKKPHIFRELKKKLTNDLIDLKKNGFAMNLDLENYLNLKTIKFNFRKNLLEMNVSGRLPQRRIAMHPTMVNNKRMAPMKIVQKFESHVVPDNLNTSTA